MNIIKFNKHKLLLNIITFTLITVFFYQDISWANGSLYLQPDTSEIYDSLNKYFKAKDISLSPIARWNLYKSLELIEKLRVQISRKDPSDIPQAIRSIFHSVDRSYENYIEIQEPCIKNSESKDSFTITIVLKGEDASRHYRLISFYDKDNPPDKYLKSLHTNWTKEDDRYIRERGFWISSTSSRVRELGYLSEEEGYDGEKLTNEDQLLLLSGLESIPTQRGGLLSVGAYYGLDMAISLDVEAIVLVDLNPKVVKSNLEVLKIIETSDDVREILPRIFKHIRAFYGKEKVEQLRKMLTLEGFFHGSRVRFGWAKYDDEFRRLKQLIKEGRVAVVQADISKPETTQTIGKFFKSHNVRLEYAYLSNATDPNSLGGITLNHQQKKEHASTLQSLYAASGYGMTIIIRSSDSTNPEVVRNARFQPKDVEEWAHEAKMNREVRFGNEIIVIPERISRVPNSAYNWEFFMQTLEAYQRHIEINFGIRIGTNTKSGTDEDGRGSPPKGTPATLLRYMSTNKIFSDNPKTSRQLAGQRGGNDSQRTIQKELKVLKAVGLVEGSPKTGYYLSDWLRDIEIEDIIRENPELNLLNPDTGQIRTVVERISFILHRDFWNRKIESGLENERLADRRYVDTVLRNVPYTSSKILTLGEGPFVIDVEAIVRAGHHVMATDFSNKAVEVLERKKSEQALDNLEVRRLDYRDDFNLSDGEFDMVISRLAIGNYDSDDQFREILLRIKRVLKKNKRSRLVFQVKSVTDSSYGKGERVAEDFFVKKDPILTNLDHYSHFWRREKLERILREAGFRVNAVDEYNKQIYKEPFGIFSLITVVAELEENEIEGEGIIGRQKRITERFIDTIRTGLTKNKGRKTILALDTDIGNMKELGINELFEQVKEVSILLGEIEFIAETGDKLPGIINDRIRELTANRKISQSDIDVVIVTKRDKGEFDASYHVTRVNDAKLESSGGYVPVLELLTFALRVNLEENNDMLRDELKQIYNEITGEDLTVITKDFVEKIKRGEFLIPLPPTKKISSEFYNEAIEILRSA